MRPVHVLTGVQLDHVELLLSGALLPLDGFTKDVPLTVPAAVTVQPGDTLELHDAEGTTVAAVTVTADEPGQARRTGAHDVVGRVSAHAGAQHEDLLDLRRPPGQHPTGRPARGVWLDEPLHTNQVAALAAADSRDVLLLCPLGAHDPGDAAWYGRAAAARAAADLLADAGVGVTLVAVPRPPRTDLVDRVVRAYGAEPVHLPAPTGALPAAVAAQLARFASPQGVVVFFTGLSGSGKSTVARALTARIMAAGQRRVTLLDGDVVRRHLSAGLTFSAADRDVNVRRIAWVAAEVARHGGVAVACPIAPYDAARQAARAMAEQVGARFLLVHVATAIEVCEQRDRKGLYARARAGTLPGFTGVSDPYEPPARAEVRLDTALHPVERCVQTVLEAARLPH